MDKRQHLRRLLSSISDESDEEDGLPQHSTRGERNTKFNFCKLLKKSICVFFILAVACGISFWAGTRVSTRQSTLDGVCAKHTNQWCKTFKSTNVRDSNSKKFIAPLVRDVAIRYKGKEFNGSFMHENIYRQVGSPEVDKAWEDLGVNCEYPGIMEAQMLYLTINRSSWCYLIRGWPSQRARNIFCPAREKVWRRFSGQRRRDASFALPGNYYCLNHSFQVS